MDPKVRFTDDKENACTSAIDNQNRGMIENSKNQVKKMSHEEWIRCKDHQQSLREVLILEAKRDLYEKLLRMQAELDERNGERERRMYEWEEQKLIQEALEKEM